MIAIILNKAEFEYDVHSLVKAFYPGEEVYIYAPIPETKSGTGARDIEKIDEYDFESKIYVEYDIPNNKASVKIDNVCSTFDISYENRIDTKNVLKRNIYRVLSEHTGVTLPWGTLTGIRPTKFALDFLYQGKTKEEIKKYLKETFCASDSKINLALIVAGNEKKLLDELDLKDGYSLYVGIPFCPSTCLYCSFTSYSLEHFSKKVDDYLSALLKELDFTAEACKNKSLNSVYIGGGTPTTLNERQLEILISHIKEKFDLSHCLEFTVEAGRPDSISEGKLKVLKDLGITRISVNPQTMCQETLDIIGRRHTVLQTLNAYEMARDMGFDNINMDLILGLPNEDKEVIGKTLDWMRKISPDNLTVHSLAIKRAARLNMFKEEYKSLSIENTGEIMDMTMRLANDLEMEPYYLYRQKNMAGNFENVGYAKKGKACIYNVLIMEEKQTIMACGAGASTKFVFEGGTERIIAQKDIDTYINNLDELINKKKSKMEELRWL